MIFVFYFFVVAVPASIKGIRQTRHNEVLHLRDGGGRMKPPANDIENNNHDNQFTLQFRH